MQTYLAHHGILGMKWGVRRYQNKDGTLTKAGKKRYSIDKANEYADSHKVAGATEFTRLMQDVYKKKYGVDKKDEKSDFTINKGAVLNRYASADDPAHSGRKYVSVTDDDRSTYSEMAYEGALGTSPEQIKLHRYESTRKLLVAGVDTVDKALRDEIKDKTLSEMNFRREYAKAAVQEWITSYGDIPAAHFFDIEEKAYTSDHSYAPREIKDVLNKGATIAGYIRGNIMFNKGTDSAIFNKLASKGYDAMIDMEDYGLAELPLIVFSSETNMKLGTIK